MLNILYAGSPDISTIPLKLLINNMLINKDFKVVGVLTNPPSAKKRSSTLIPTPVAALVQEENEKNGLNIPVFTPEKLDADIRNKISEVKPDLLICFAYGKLFGPKFMELFSLGGINIHPSLLPKYRGCAPVPAAILNMDCETGVSIQKIAQQMDTGNILAQELISLDGTETADSLLIKSSEIGGTLLLNLIKQIIDNNKVPEGIPQDEAKSSYSKMLKKEDGCINWNSSAKEIDALIRAFSPWPGSFTCVNDIQLKILEAHIYTKNLDENIIANMSEAKKNGTVIGVDKKEGILFQTGNGILCVTKLQWQAKKAVNWNDFINGSRNFIGTCCGIQE